MVKFLIKYLDKNITWNQLFLIVSYKSIQIISVYMFLLESFCGSIEYLNTKAFLQPIEQIE